MIYEKVLGPEHPHTATALNNLADHYEIQDEHHKAEPLYQQVLVIYKNVLGPEHPYTVETLKRLAHCHDLSSRDMEIDEMR
ncbi:hypothetical protein BC936DRAFT_137732 [Jimgerdemannia flammicorona]|uniref:Kinesin light chain n=1 Tax=Jimgerdemannia flammicorona TaxID=994334 RepID=A0A433DN05_9FUNG|nr:hypothetical protein BC936DRAFT_137732 [Jimgerdemannia flammicorona]